MEHLGSNRPIHCKGGKLKAPARFFWVVAMGLNSNVKCFEMRFKERKGTCGQLCACGAPGSSLVVGVSIGLPSSVENEGLVPPTPGPRDRDMEHRDFLDETSDRFENWAFVEFTEWALRRWARGE